MRMLPLRFDVTTAVYDTGHRAWRMVDRFPFLSLLPFVSERDMSAARSIHLSLRVRLYRLHLLYTSRQSRTSKPMGARHSNIGFSRMLTSFHLRSFCTRPTLLNFGDIISPLYFLSSHPSVCNS